MGLEASAGAWAVCTLSVAVFVAGFPFSGITWRAALVIAVAREAMAMIADKTIPDAAKEEWLQQASFRLFMQFGAILLVTLVLLTASGLVLWLGEWLGIAPLETSLNLLSRWQVILGGSVLFIVAFWLGGWRKGRR